MLSELLKILSVFFSVHYYQHPRIDVTTSTSTSEKQVPLFCRGITKRLQVQKAASSRVFRYTQTYESANVLGMIRTLLAPHVCPLSTCSAIQH